MARWDEALDAQLDCYRLAMSDDGERYLRNFMSTQSRSWGGDAPGYLAHYANVGERLKAHLFNADTVYIDADMFALAKHASESFAPEPLVPEDLPTPEGFMLLPEPIVVHDIHGKVVSYRAVSWMPDQWRHHGAMDAGVSFMLWSYRGDPDAHGWQQFSSWRWSMLHLAPWTFGIDYTDPRHQTLDPDIPPENIYGAAELAKLLQPLWRLMMMPLAHRSHQRPGKHARRRAERLKVPERNIAVVTLRRFEGDTDRDRDHRTVEWSCRWVVSGHWRNQWYPSLGRHRQVWIAPYVKGPEDAELRVRKAHIIEWVR